MGILIPTQKIPYEEYVRKMESFVETAMKIARERGITGELAYRFLRPSDLGLTDWSFSLSAGKNSDVVNVTLKDDFLVLIYGIQVQNSDPVTREIVLRTPNETMDDWPIGHLLGYDIVEGIADEPIAYGPGSTIQIDVNAVAAGTDRIVLLGIVVGPKGSIVLDAKK